MNPIPVPDAAKAGRPYCRVVDMGRPRGVPESECGSAEMLLQFDGPNPLTGFGGREQYAYFRPTAEELELLNAGGFLEMCQIGTVVQPFSLAVWPLAEPDSHCGNRACCSERGHEGACDERAAL